MVPDYARALRAAKLGHRPSGRSVTPARTLDVEVTMIRKLASGGYRLYSRKKDAKGHRKNLGTFSSRAAAEKHEREVQYFKRG